MKYGSINSLLSEQNRALSAKVMKINIQRTILCQEGVLFLRKNRILDKIESVLKCVNY